MINNKNIADELNRLYRSDGVNYMKYVHNLKSSGYKIYKNSENMHIVKGGVPDVFSSLF